MSDPSNANTQHINCPDCNSEITLKHIEAALSELKKKKKTRKKILLQTTMNTEEKWNYILAGLKKDSNRVRWIKMVKVAEETLAISGEKNCMTKNKLSAQRIGELADESVDLSTAWDVDAYGQPPSPRKIAIVASRWLQVGRPSSKTAPDLTSLPEHMYS